MGSLKVLNETPISMFEVKKKLEEIEKKGHLSARAIKTKEYLNVFVKDKKGEELIKKLKCLDISRLSDKSIVSIANLRPKEADGLKVVLSSENLTLKQDDLKKIISVVNEN